MRRCIITGCSRKHKAKNFCIQHYQEFYYTFHPKSRARERQTKEILALTKIPYRTVRKIIISIFDIMTEALRRGESVQISGLGRFDVINKKVYFEPASNITKALNKENDVHN